MQFGQDYHTFRNSIVEGKQNCTEERKGISMYK